MFQLYFCWVPNSGCPLVRKNKETHCRGSSATGRTVKENPSHSIHLPSTHPRNVDTTRNEETLLRETWQKKTHCCLSLFTLLPFGEGSSRISCCVTRLQSGSFSSGSSKTILHTSTIKSCLKKKRRNICLFANLVLFIAFILLWLFFCSSFGSSVAQWRSTVCWFFMRRFLFWLNHVNDLQCTN